jgi:hypothetical protein
VVVVSEDGPVTVFSDGATAAQVRNDPCVTGFPVTSLSAPGGDNWEIVSCRRCKRPLVVDEVRIDAWAGGPELLACPVCGAEVRIDVYRAAIRGVAKSW